MIVDDILVHGRDQAEHDSRLEVVMSKIKEIGLHLNKEKCKFRKSEVSYFGHLVGSYGVNSKGILGDFSLICELNCYQTISSPICL